MKRLMLLVVLAALMGLLVACGGAVEQAAQDIAPTLQAAAEELAPTVEAAVEEVAPTVEAAVEEAVATEVPAAEEAAAEGTFLERAKAGEFAGTTVTLLGVMVDEEAQKMELALAPFEEATGIDVVYELSLIHI